ncbi:MAG: hypothetical protein HQK52_11085 [Oligoflexia bacterium]|nr:hypothetical protein [Oligoflexia bacterium]
MWMNVSFKYFIVLFLMGGVYQISTANAESSDFPMPHKNGFPPKGFRMDRGGPPPMGEGDLRPPSSFSPRDNHPRFDTNETIGDDLIVVKVADSKPDRAPGFLGPKISANIIETSITKDATPLLHHSSESSASKKGDDFSLEQAKDLIQNFDIKLDPALGLVELTGNFPSICKNDLRVVAMDTPSSSGYVHFRIIDFTGKGISCLQSNKKSCDEIPCISLSDLGKNTEISNQYQVRMKLKNVHAKIVKIGILHHKTVQIKKEETEDISSPPLIYLRLEEVKTGKSGSDPCNRKNEVSPEGQIRQSISSSIGHKDFDRIRMEIEKDGPSPIPPRRVSPDSDSDSKKDRKKDEVPRKSRENDQNIRDRSSDFDNEKNARPSRPDRRRPQKRDADDEFSKISSLDPNDPELMEMEMLLRNKNRSRSSVSTGMGTQQTQNANGSFGRNTGGMGSMEGMNGNMMGMMGLGSGMGGSIGFSPMMNMGGFGYAYGGSMGGMNGNMMGMGGNMGMMGLGSGQMNFSSFPSRSTGNSNMGFKGGFAF